MRSGTYTVVCCQEGGAVTIRHAALVIVTTIVLVGPMFIWQSNDFFAQMLGVSLAVIVNILFGMET